MWWLMLAALSRQSSDGAVAADTADAADAADADGKLPDEPGPPGLSDILVRPDPRDDRSTQAA